MERKLYNAMAPTLDELLGDSRLSRLFSSNTRNCALQLWVLKIQSDNLIEMRVVYGRLLPYNYSSNSWSFSDNDDSFVFGRMKAKLTRLNLYIKSNQCSNLLRKLSSGHSIADINKSMGFECPKKLTKQFGAVSLTESNLSYRPVSYLINRDAYDSQSLSSPHSTAGALSASIIQMDKSTLFEICDEYSSALIVSVIEQLNLETGLDFGRADATRFGDIELLVFPTLNDLDQNLLLVKWLDSSCSLSVRFNPSQVSYFDKFQFHLKIENDGQIISSTIAPANPDEEGIFEYEFQVSEEVRRRTDSTELEIFGSRSDSSHVGVLCSRWKINYIREMNFQGHVVGQSASLVKFDWLEKATRPAMSDRVKAALTVKRDNMGFGNSVGGRKVDPWVPVNREFLSLLTRFNPPKSEGQFFQRWSMGDGEGRLQFVEWFASLLSKYQQHQIVIFDPYFETAGLGLVLICAVAGSDYIVFTSLPKVLKVAEEAQDERSISTSERLNNLMSSCDHNSHLLKRVKLRIYGLKEGRLHDRYILIMDQGKLPVAGFHLSNSFQNAAENYPLLITPIPGDVLLKVEKYKSVLVKEAMTSQPNSEKDNPAMQLLFDSAASSPAAARHYEPLHFLERPEAGNVLSVWSGESSLKGLQGEQLRAQMMMLGLLSENSIVLSNGLKNCLKKQLVNSNGFTVIWGLLGELLAHTSSGDMEDQDLDSESDFLEFLHKFIETSFERVNDNLDKELAVIDMRLFKKPIEDLFHSSYRIGQLFHPTKYAALTWSEYFAIKFLWLHAPSCVLKIFENQVASLPVNPDEKEVVRLSLLSQIVSEIALSIQFNIKEIQRDNLLRSNFGLLKWMGFSAVERQLEEPGGLGSVMLLLESVSHKERVLALGWMVNHAGSKEIEIYKDLVAAFHEVLPETIPMDELQYLVNSMRGHMRQLAWAEPWLFQDVVLPLLESDRASTEDVCAIWMHELASMLGPKNQPRLFTRAREGRTTNIASYLFAHSSPEKREVSLGMINDILKQQRRSVQQPLANTVNWAQWDDALRVSLWILAFCKWSELYLCQLGMADEKLDQLTQDARQIAMVRPLAEWQSEGASKLDELVLFLTQAEDLLGEGKQ